MSHVPADTAVVLVLMSPFWRGVLKHRLLDKQLVVSVTALLKLYVALILHSKKMTPDRRLLG